MGWIWLILVLSTVVMLVAAAFMLRRKGRELDRAIKAAAEVLRTAQLTGGPDLIDDDPTMFGDPLELRAHVARLAARRAVRRRRRMALHRRTWARWGSASE